MTSWKSVEKALFCLDYDIEWSTWDSNIHAYYVTPTTFVYLLCNLPTKNENT